MIYYLCPDYDVPSWGVGMLYYHVAFLTKNNIDACVLHEKKGFKISWLRLNVPVMYLDKKMSPGAADILVVPDVFTEDKRVEAFSCRKILFVQNAFIFFERISSVNKINRLDYEAVFYYMPHLKKVLSDFFRVPLYETPAFIAPYYYKDEKQPGIRRKEILIYPKFNSRDYTILEKLLSSRFPFQEKATLGRLFSKKKSDEWVVRVLQQYSHQELADIMKEAYFFININTHEAFNSSVPEAMAAGCINLTYEALGPGDFLQHHINACVYPNNYVFDLYKQLIYYTDHFEEEQVQQELHLMRQNGYHVADTYTVAIAEVAIVDTFRKLLR